MSILLQTILYSVGGFAFGILLIFIHHWYLCWRIDRDADEREEILMENLKRENKRFEESLGRGDWDEVDQSLKRMERL